MTGREALFLLLGFIIGIIATEIFQFIKGFVLWTRGEKNPVIQQIDLDKMEKQGASSFRIDTDETGMYT